MQEMVNTLKKKKRRKKHNTLHKFWSKWVLNRNNLFFFFLPSAWKEAIYNIIANNISNYGPWTYRFNLLCKNYMLVENILFVLLYIAVKCQQAWKFPSFIMFLICDIISLVIPSLATIVSHYKKLAQTFHKVCLQLKLRKWQSVSLYFLLLIIFQSQATI